MEPKTELHQILYEAKILPIIAHLGTTHGEKTRLVKAYQQHDAAATRQTVESWLIPDATRRRMPPLDRGLLLLHVASKLMKPKRKISQTTDPKTTKP